MVVDLNTVLLSGLALAGAVTGALLLERTRHIDSMKSRLEAVEMYAGQMHTEIMNSRDDMHHMPFPPMMGGMPEMGGENYGIYRSLDGKHTASTLDELIRKMSGDDPSTSNDDLHNLFNDDEDDEDEPWKKGK